jgi:release factor glutamine methyltransferase
LQTWTVRRLLEWADNFFSVKGIPQPRLSAEQLLSSVLNLSRMQLFLNYDYILKDNQLAKFKGYILKRLEHVPIQYILNEAYFRNLKLYVDQNVLIPRPETELLVDKAILIIRKILGGDAPYQKTINILEVGTGSGAIALSIASEIGSQAEKDRFNNNIKEESGNYGAPFENYKIIATDINAGALEVARKNAKKVLKDDAVKRVEFINCDTVPDGDKKFNDEFGGNFNIVISNPPYISKEDYKNLPREVKDYEPMEALLAGKTGIEFYKKILHKIKPFLDAACCYLIFETDPKVSPTLKELLQKDLNPKSIEIDRDYNQRERIVTVKIG